MCVCASDYYQFLTCCTASTTTMGVMPHSVVVGVYGVGWCVMCMLREGLCVARFSLKHGTAVPRRSVRPANKVGAVNCNEPVSTR